MLVAVTGASGVLGKALVPALRRSGHDVKRLVRRPANAVDEVSWDPTAGTVDLAGLQGVEAVVNLAGAGVADKRWTEDYKHQILASRVDSTRTIAEAMTRLPVTPRVLLNASAVGFYGDRGEQVLLETSSRGDGFLADVVVAWEAATDVAAAAGIRTVHLRTGLVMAASGGAFGRLLPLFKVGAGGRLGDGQMWWPWITLLDEIRAIQFLLDHELSGPVNLGSPNPARNADVTVALGRALHRPTLLPVPRFALHAALGEFATDVTASQRMLPQVLLDAGFDFAHPELPAAVDWLTGT